MLTRDYRDIVGGALLFVVGIAFAWYAAGHYQLGTLQRMGPGMFPTGLGAILAVLGVALFIPAFFRTGVMPEIRIWTPLFVLAGCSAFALAIRPLGLIPAIVAVVAISSLAELKVRPVGLIALCGTLCLIAWLVFRVLLGLPMVLVRWPF